LLLCAFGAKGWKIKVRSSFRLDEMSFLFFGYWFALLFPQLTKKYLAIENPTYNLQPKAQRPYN